MARQKRVLGSSDVVWNEEEDRPRKVRGEFILPKVTLRTDLKTKTGTVNREETMDVEDSVKTFLQDNSKQLGNIPPIENLKIIQDLPTLTRRILRFQQLHDGKPVLDSTMTVQLDKNKRIKQLDLGYSSKTNAIRGSADSKIGTDEAIEFAMGAVSEINFALRQKPEKPELVYYPTKAGLKLAYNVLIPTQKPPHDWRIIVDAYSGEILEKRDLVVRSHQKRQKNRLSRTNSMPKAIRSNIDTNGQGLVFDPNPVVTGKDNSLREPDAAQTCEFSKSNRSTIDAQRVTRTLKDIKFSNRKYRLEGPYVKMENLADPSVLPPEENNADKFSYSTADHRFDDVNVYYHIDTCQRYIQSLGITTARNSQIKADAHDNSLNAAWYSSGFKTLHFSDSGPCRPDRAEDGDVMLHEYGHAIQDDQVPGWGAKPNPLTGREEAGAMGEGFGDILACVFFAQHGGGYQREVFEDWVFGDRGGLRRVDGNKVYPKDWHGKIHDDGEIWSAALWNIYRTIGGDSVNPAEVRAAQDAALKTVILSHHYLAPDASMPDGAEAVMQADAELDEYLGKHMHQMLDSFHDRGLLVCDKLSDLYIRDAPDDPGSDRYLGSVFWNSPDVWVRNTDDDNTSHQDPKYGQDNWFYARIHNRGTVTARAFVVTFNVRPWLGTQFVYPQDFIPYVSATVAFNLPPGESTIVKAKWPSSPLIPADKHMAVLVSVYMPTDALPTGRHVWEYNNLAQKNLISINLLPNNSALIPLQFGNLNIVEQDIYKLELHRPEKWSNVQVSLISKNDPQIIKEIFNSVDSGRTTSTRSNVSAVQPKSMIRFSQPTRVEIVHSGPQVDPIILNLNKGSTLDINAGKAFRQNQTNTEIIENGREADLLLDKTGAPHIVFHPGVLVGMPLEIKPRSPISIDLKITAPPEAKLGDLEQIHLVQRNKEGQVIGGVTVQITIMEGK